MNQTQSLNHQIATNPQAAQVLLQFDGLRGGYGDTAVLRAISGQVSRGECLAIAGRNGVGKSTLVRLLMGYLTPFAGSLLWQGASLAKVPTFERNQLGMSYAPQESVVFDELSVEENLILHRAQRNLDAYRACFERFPRLRERLKQRAGTLSGGEKKLLSFSRVWVETNPLAILDEPTEGVQKENIDHMAALVQEQKAQGRAFLIVEQNIEFLELVADRVLVLDHGEVVASGAYAEFGRERLGEFLTV